MKEMDIIKEIAHINIEMDTSLKHIQELAGYVIKMKKEKSRLVDLLENVGDAE